MLQDKQLSTTAVGRFVEGMDPVPAPANQLIKYGSQKRNLWFVPSSANIAMMEAVIHEYAGTFWAKAVGN